MSDQGIIKAIQAQSEAVNETTASLKNNDLPLDSLILLITTNKIRTLEENTKKELKELQTRQGQVRYLHKLLTGINSITDSKGNFDWTQKPEYKELLTQAKEMGADIDLSKTKYTREEKDRLTENIKLICDDLNVQNEMQLQTISRLTNERYEMYQLARSILKPLHDDKINKARAISGR